jgi:hypothetical protein
VNLKGFFLDGRQFSSGVGGEERERKSAYELMCSRLRPFFLSMVLEYSE